MENQELLREYYNERIRGFGQRKFEELNEYQLRHLKGSMSYIGWRISRAFDTNFKAIMRRLGWK
jgi:hypothetical protein